MFFPLCEADLPELDELENFFDKDPYNRPMCLDRGFKKSIRCHKPMGHFGLHMGKDRDSRFWVWPYDNSSDHDF